MAGPGAPVGAKPAADAAGVTTGLEIAAYIIAQSVKLSAVYGLSFVGLLGALYGWAMQTGGPVKLYAVSIGLSIVWGALTLVLFFGCRRFFGGAPAGTRRGAEIGLFALAYAIVVAMQLILNAAVMSQVYRALGPTTAPLLGFGLSLVFAVLVFALFLALRQLIRGERRHDPR